jgi:hypothetical protein
MSEIIEIRQTKPTFLVFMFVSPLFMVDLPPARQGP